MADLDNTQPVDSTEQDEEGKPSLSKTLAAGQQAITQAASTGEPTAPLPVDDQQFYLQRLKELDQNPEFQSSAPPSSRDSLKEAISSANDLYKQNASRNDWLNVAQTIGRAVAQFTAAQQANASGGKFVGSAPMGEAHDYVQDNARALSERNNSVGDAYKDAALNREDYLDADKIKRENYANQHDYLTRGLDVSSKNASLSSSETRADLRARAMAAQEAAREQARDTRQDKSQEQSRAFEADKMSRFEIANKRKQLDDEEKSLTPQVKAGLTLASDQGLKDSLSSKDASKLQQQYGALAGTAGVDLTDAMSKYNNAAPKKDRTVLGIPVGGLLGQTTDDSSPEARKTLLDALGLTDKLERLKQIRAERQAISGAGQPAPSDVQSKSVGSSSSGNSVPAPASVPAPPSTPAADTDRVKVRSKNGVIGTLPRSQLDQALSQGYTEVK